MLLAPLHLSARTILRAAWIALIIAILPSAAVAQSNETLPLDQVRPGMQGYAYTIFAGDQVEKFDLEVIGVMPNFLGPRQSIILVQLKGPKVERTGVVAGMSGSPVYLDGKLAGALSLKLPAIFAKDPIAGVTPIEDVIHPPAQTSALSSATTQPFPVDGSSLQKTAPAFALPSSSNLAPIETTLVFSGFQSATVQQFAPQIQSYGFVAAQGGTSAPGPEDGHLVPGDMAGMVLVQGDASIYSACTVTAVQAERVFLCGHPFLNLGEVQIPMARSRVLTTLSSDLACTRIVSIGGSIGGVTGDHLTAVTGKLGAPPPMIPLDLAVATKLGEKKMHFDIINHPKLTPLLVAITTFNGLTQNAIYGEGTTLHLTGEIRLRGRTPVQIENTYAPGDALIPDGLPIAVSVQSIFARLFVNTFEVPEVERIALRVESVPAANPSRSTAPGSKRATPLPAKPCASASSCIRIAVRPALKKRPCESPTKSPAAPRCASLLLTAIRSTALRAASRSAAPAGPPDSISSSPSSIASAVTIDYTSGCLCRRPPSFGKTKNSPTLRSLRSM